MLEGLKRFIPGNRAPAGSGWDDVALWAEQRQYPFRSVPGEGYVVDGRAAGTDWRLEWGPSQRDYLQGPELRLRAELPVSSALQLVVMTRALQESMEKSLFEQAVESVQTRIDSQTPPETRWLVMFRKLPRTDMGALHDGFVAVSSMRNWLSMWLRGPLSAALAATATEPVSPLVLMMGRGRLTMRTALPTPDVASLQPWLRLFETAIREAKRVTAEKPRLPTETEASSAFPASALPEEEGRA